MNLFTQKSAIGKVVAIAGIVMLALAAIELLENLGYLFESFVDSSTMGMAYLLEMLTYGDIAIFVSTGLLLLGLGEVIRLLSVAAGEEGAGK